MLHITPLLSGSLRVAEEQSSKRKLPTAPLHKRRDGRRQFASSILRIFAVIAVLSALLTNQSLASSDPDPSTDDVLKRLSLAQLGNVEVTTTSKEPEQVWKTPAAVYVLTRR